MTVSGSASVEASIAGRLRRAGCVFAEDEAALLVSEAATPEELELLVGQRVAGRPLEQVLGWAEFAGRRIVVQPGVFVPRRRTELLVREAIAVAPDPAIVVDLCCGSGAVGAAVSAALETVELHAADIDPAAVACARRNLAAAGGQVYLGDLFDPLPAALRGRIDLLVVNAPYVPTDAVAGMPPEARDHEPRTSLDGGPDGLDVLHRVTVAAPEWLAPGGHLLVETSGGQARAMAAAMAESGLRPAVRHDEELAATVVIGTRR
jgi:release factor glutamine methyltransferase